MLIQGGKRVLARCERLVVPEGEGAGSAFIEWSGEPFDPNRWLHLLHAGARYAVSGPQRLGRSLGTFAIEATLRPASHEM